MAGCRAFLQLHELITSDHYIWGVMGSQPTSGSVQRYVTGPSPLRPSLCLVWGLWGATAGLEPATSLPVPWVKPRHVVNKVLSPLSYIAAFLGSLVVHVCRADLPGSLHDGREHHRLDPALLVQLLRRVIRVE